ncbi:MAG: SCO family protein [Leptonema sp. (in: Bacteria)]|nr:SCO family protein [Leptonema sp. (in: bacteria)]
MIKSVTFHYFTLHPKRILRFGLACIISLSFANCQHEPFPLKDLGRPSEFELIDTQGQPYHYKPNSGTVRLVFFGYTYCPDYCPATMAKLRKVIPDLKIPEAEKPEVLFISVDPERDTPEKLAGYLKGYSINAIGLTGSTQALEVAAKEFHTFFQIEKKGDQIIVDHTTFLYLIDPEGRMRYMFRNSDSADTIKHALLTLYAELD